MIAGIDANQHRADATSLWCVTAKVLISNANDAVTQVTQDFRRTLRGRSQASGRGMSTRRCDRKTAGPTRKNASVQSLAVGPTP